MKRQVSPSRITMTSVSLGYCIRWAYGIRDYQLIGPDWVVAANLAHYDIGAVTSEPSSEDRLKALSRTLLAQRFGLEMHQETRSIPMFALRVVKDGPKFSKAPDDENAGILPAGQYAFAAHNTTMARLAEILASPWTARPVIDETGLPGGYDFHLDLSRYVTDEQTGQPAWSKWRDRYGIRNHGFPARPTGSPARAYARTHGCFDSRPREQGPRRELTTFSYPALRTNTGGARNELHRRSAAGFSLLSAFSIARSATAFTIHSKFSGPTEL